MRRGEILGLKWSDVDFANKRIHVNRSLAHIPKRGYTLTTPKTKSSKRQIPIPEFVRIREPGWLAFLIGGWHDGIYIIAYL
jgi:integrase